MKEVNKTVSAEAADTVRELPPEKVTIVLSFPIKHASEDDPISKLEIRRPKAKDLRDVPSSPKVGDLLNLGAKLAGVPPSVMDKLEMADWNRVAEVLGDFLQGGQTTGEKSSD